jgi:hypothetical protein
MEIQTKIIGYHFIHTKMAITKTKTKIIINLGKDVERQRL